MRNILSATAAMLLATSVAHATTVNNTDLPPVNGNYGAGVATTTTSATGTVTTVNGPGGGANRADAPPSTNQWAQHNVGGNASVGITTERARSGNGSVAFTGLTANDSKADLEYYFATPIPLASFTSAAYDWFRASTSTNNGIQTASLRLLMVNPGASNPFTALIYEPYYQESTADQIAMTPVATDAWTTENIGLGSQFWNNNGSLTNPGAFTNPLSAWIAANPAAAIYGLSSGIGSGWNGQFFGGIDNVAYNFGAGGSNSFNFEVAAVAGVPEPATWAMTILGFGVIGTMTRRRRRAAFVVA
ncbi:MAG: PEPxxWA-CTERM sorting domain-containing protein [Sphingomonadaceae bacterium]|nr:PEPxxWA-CTERM sorting domain-containing protein [Sphingomonadaceae bacterium]